MCTPRGAPTPLACQGHTGLVEVRANMKGGDLGKGGGLLISHTQGEMKELQPVYSDTYVHAASLK